VLTPAARQDRRDEVRYYRQEAGSKVAVQPVEELQKALGELERNPSIGSPLIGQRLDIAGLRSWRLNRFPLSVWYFERGDHVLVIRVVGHRQAIEGIDLD
jgi:toxin ParE1/3/4